MVAAAAYGGRILVIGDTFSAAYPLSDMKHRPFLFQRMSEARDKIWREGMPKIG
jgi:hypothetical protein